MRWRSFHALPVLVLLLTACQSHNPAPVAFYRTDPNATLPPISFYTKKPSAELAQNCKPDQCGEDNRILERIYTQLQQSGAFEEVSVGNMNRADYGVHVTLRRFTPGTTADGLAKAVVAGATLLLVPVSMKNEYKSEYVVTWRNVKIAEYAFDTPFDHKVSLYDDPLKQLDYVAESIASQFIAAAQGDAVFSSERIYSTLKAEDYHRDLKPPLQLGAYKHTNFLLYPDPLLGAQLRYQNEKTADEINDVFIYPIRQTVWADQDKTSAMELDNAVKDIDLAVKAGAYKTASLGTHEMLKFSVNGATLTGHVVSGNLIWKDGRATTDYLYVFLLKDKYVKFRFSVPNDSASRRPQLDEFVAAFLREATVPDESFFMASLRQQQRTTSIH